MKTIKKLCILTAVFIFLSQFSICQPVFATANLALCVGTNYGLFGIDTTEDAETAGTLYRNAGYDTTVYIKPTYDLLNGYTYRGIKYMQSDILFFSGHGNYDRMTFNYNGTGGDYATGIYRYNSVLLENGAKLVGIQGNMSGVKLVTFAGCMTASNNDQNICAQAVTYGAKTAVGWEESINQGSHTEWLKRYNQCLLDGKTVQAAVNYANSFTYADARVKTSKIYGDTSLRISHVSTASANLDDALMYLDVVDECIGYDLNNSVLTEFAKKNIDNFNPSCYEITVFNTSADCFTVDFVFMIDNCRTNSSYTMHIQDGRITQIIDNSIKTPMTTVDFATISDCVERQMNVCNDTAAVVNTNEYEGYSIYEQNIEYHYDFETQMLNEITFTTYYSEDMGTFFSDMTIREVS